MPASVAAQHALIKYGPCEVEIVFNLSELGVPSVAESIVTKERCKAFVSSATTALKASEFSKGKKVEGCTINFTMDVDLEE